MAPPRRTNALEERTRERVPLEWAGSQYNLSLALEAWATRTGGTAPDGRSGVCILQAVDQYEEAGDLYRLSIARDQARRMQVVRATLSKAAVPPQ